MMNDMADHFRNKIKLWRDSIKYGIQVPSHIDRSEVELYLRNAAEEIERLDKLVYKQNTKD